MKRLLVVLSILTALAAARPSAQNGATAARPSLRFEKHRFVVGEPVFFWITISDAGSNPIPSSLFGTVKVILTRPDLTTRTDTVGWPIDGAGAKAAGDLGNWSGGFRLRETPEVGTWVAVSEFAGYRSPPMSFTVENVPLLSAIEAEFAFSLPLSLDSPDARVTLKVMNHFSEPIRFVQRGQWRTSLDVDLNRISGEKWHSGFGVPRPLLLNATGTGFAESYPDIFTRTEIERVPTVRLALDQQYELAMPLIDVLKEANNGRAIPPGDYDVSFATELELLVGDRADTWKDFEPIRFLITSTAKGKKN